MPLPDPELLNKFLRKECNPIEMRMVIEWLQETTNEERSERIEHPVPFRRPLTISIIIAVFVIAAWLFFFFRKARNRSNAHVIPAVSVNVDNFVHR